MIEIEHESVQLESVTLHLCSCSGLVFIAKKWNHIYHL
jgi:hypothetical protein